MKIDPYNHEKRYKEWKAQVLIKGIPNISKRNSEIILQYLNDMEHGLNVSLKSVKGGRSYIRLNTLREKLSFFSKKFEEIYNLECITEITENQLVLFFSKMRKGEITRNDGKTYQSTPYFVKVFKSFWHWYHIINKKKSIELPDITLDLDSRGDKPKWVYLTEEQVKRLCNNSKWKYKVLIMFLFDTGIRSPTELVNIRVSDFYNDFKELVIREEVSKTFGRKIKLMLCSQQIKEYILEEGFEQDDYIFSIKPATANLYLQRLAKRVLGEEKSLAGESYSKLTMYDFRHCSCCYWLPRYKSESALKYRFGWKKSDKIHYYSELLGMEDTITQDDIVLSEERTELEKNLKQTSKENEILKDRMIAMEEKVNKFMEAVIKIDKLLEKL